MKNQQLNHRSVLSLALPMILSNISTPLLGLIDTAVLGHLDSELYLAAVALGGLIFSFIFWGFGFLRMGTTGLTAHAVGSGEQREVNAVLLRALTCGLIISSLLIVFKQPIVQLGFSLLHSDTAIKQLAIQYFEIRIISAPATLCLYALMGWFLGQQNVKVPLLVVLISNVINSGLDVWFVYYLNMQITGVALATVFAEYIGLGIALIAASRTINKQQGYWYWQDAIKLSKLKAMLLINSHIFIRTWCLIFAFAFFTAQAAKMGSVMLAANTVLLNFQTFMAYALDGFAHAAEALVGKAVGAKNKGMVRKIIITAGLWSATIAIFFVLIYSYFGRDIVSLLTNLTEVKNQAYQYLPWLIAMPLVSFICYLLDGVFVGAMLTAQMRNTMLFSLFAVFLPTWYYSQHLGNTGLWLAMTLFMLARSLSMLVVIKRTRLLN